MIISLLVFLMVLFVMVTMLFYSEGSVGVWKCFGDYLKVYCKKNMLFSQIDKPFADRFTLFLERKGLMMHTVNKHVSCFRKLCNLAAMEGYNSNAVSLRV